MFLSRSPACHHRRLNFLIALSDKILHWRQLLLVSGEHIAWNIHPDIHNKVGAAGGNANANPNGVNENGGQIHGIGATPGQAGTNPNDDGTKGFANELGNVHGGIGEVNQNVDWIL